MLFFLYRFRACYAVKWDLGAWWLASLWNSPCSMAYVYHISRGLYWCIIGFGSKEPNTKNTKSCTVGRIPQILFTAKQHTVPYHVIDTVCQISFTGIDLEEQFAVTENIPEWKQTNQILQAHISVSFSHTRLWPCRVCFALNPHVTLRCACKHVGNMSVKTRLKFLRRKVERLSLILWWPYLPAFRIRKHSIGDII